MEDKMNYDYAKNTIPSQSYFNPGMKIPGAISYDLRKGEKEIKDEKKISVINGLLETIEGKASYPDPKWGQLVICNTAGEEKYIIFVNTKEKIRKTKDNKMISTQLTAKQTLDAIWWNEKLINNTNRVLEKFKMSISGGPKAKTIMLDLGNKQICCFIEYRGKGQTSVEASKGHFQGRPATPEEIKLVKAKVEGINKTTDNVMLKLINEIINPK